MAAGLMLDETERRGEEDELEEEGLRGEGHV